MSVTIGLVLVPRARTSATVRPIVNKHAHLARVLDELYRSESAAFGGMMWKSFFPDLHFALLCAENPTVFVRLARVAAFPKWKVWCNWILTWRREKEEGTTHGFVQAEKQKYYCPFTEHFWTDFLLQRRLFIPARPLLPGVLFSILFFGGSTPLLSSSNALLAFLRCGKAWKALSLNSGRQEFVTCENAGERNSSWHESGFMVRRSNKQMDSVSYWSRHDSGIDSITPVGDIDETKGNQLVIPKKKETKWKVELIWHNS